MRGAEVRATRRVGTLPRDPPRRRYVAACARGDGQWGSQRRRRGAVGASTATISMVGCRSGPAGVGTWAGGRPRQSRGPNGRGCGGGGSRCPSSFSQRAGTQSPSLHWVGADPRRSPPSTSVRGGPSRCKSGAASHRRARRMVRTDLCTVIAGLARMKARQYSAYAIISRGHPRK